MNDATRTINNRRLCIPMNVGGILPTLIVRRRSSGAAAHHRGVLRFLTSLSLLCGLVSTTAAQTPTTVETVLRAWEARQERIRTLWMEYEQVDTTPKGMAPIPFVGEGGAPVSFPPEDMRLTSQWEFAIEGAKRRYAGKGTFVDMQTAQYVPQERITASTGPLTKILTRYDNSKDERLIPTGIIFAGADNPDFINMTLWPCLAAYRPLQIAQLTGFSKEYYDVRKNADVIEGVPCTLFSQRASAPSGPMRYLLWIDGSPNLKPLRIQSIVMDPRIPEGRIGTQVDIHYEPSSTNGIQLKSWRVQTFADNSDPNKAKSGVLMMQAEGTVKRIALNEPIDPARFDVDFPEGTFFSDHSTGQSQNLYALKGGGRRPILPAEQEAGLSRDKILNSNPGELVPALVSKGSISTSVLWGLLVLFVIGSGLLIFVVVQRRWKTTSQPLP